MADPKIQQDAQPTAGTVEANEFDSLLQKEFKPKTDEAKEAVERAVRTLAEQALSQTKLISTDVVKSIEAIIAADRQEADRADQPDPAPRRTSRSSKARGAGCTISSTTPRPTRC